MDTAHSYLHLDVFTKRALSGNQLAVFLDPPAWPAETMQAIALEMAFSETTFVFPPQRAGSLAQVRIFTPARELPVAGHPTIGTTFALAIGGRIVPGTESVVLDLGVGPTIVDLEWDAGQQLAFVWMTQPAPEFGAIFENRSQVALALGLGLEDLAAGLPVQVVSCGVPFAFVPLAGRAAVDRASAERGLWKQACAAAGIDEHQVFVFAIEDEESGIRGLYSRMFAPRLGVPEDPGTGIASGPLGSYLVRYEVSKGPVSDFLSRQGVLMKRPCDIRIRIASAGADITRVQIGGAAALAGTATLRL